MDKQHNTSEKLDNINSSKDTGNLGHAGLGSASLKDIVNLNDNRVKSSCMGSGFPDAEKLLKCIENPVVPGMDGGSKLNPTTPGMGPGGTKENPVVREGGRKTNTDTPSGVAHEKFHQIVPTESRTRS